ncbi:putative minor capsid protein [Enterococcus faecium]
MIPQMSKDYCNQSIIFRRKKGIDKWQKPIFDAEVTIENMIFQTQTIYSGSNNNRKVIANAIAFLFAGVSTPFPEITKEHIGSEIIFEGTAYTLVTIVDDRNPFSNEVYSYELEVL